MTGTFPQAWEEVALITIQKLAGTAYEYMAVIESLDISQGDYPFESVPSLAGGRIGKQSPEEDGEITIEFYPVDTGVADNGGLFQDFADGAVDSSQPLTTDTGTSNALRPGVFSAARQRNRYLFAVMWTDDTAVTAATSATSTTDSVALRFYAKECRMVSHKADFTDGILKLTVTFKYPAMNYSGSTKCWAWESTNEGNGSALPALTYATAL